MKTATLAAAAAALLAAATTALAAAPAQIEAAFAEADAKADADAPVRILRFHAPMTGEFPKRVEGQPFRPSGRVLLPAGSDMVLGDAPAPYVTEIVSGPDGFIGRGTITFARGQLHFEGAYKTRNHPTPIKGTLATPMVQKVTGGTGAFEGASGYFMEMATIDGDGIRATLNGLIFLVRGESGH
jgi:hypothetical protein